MSDYQYQTIQVDRRPMAVGGPSARGQAVGAGVELLHQLSISLGNMALSWRVKRELENLQPRIDAQMPETGGVLVCVGLQEWARPDPTGHKARTFLSIHVAGSGPDMPTVLQRYRDQPRIVQGPPRGWVRVDQFVWVTRK
jgi:hypothetical protein